MASSNPTPRRHSAGLFDVRTIIGLLLLIYGVVLVLMGIVATSSSDLQRAAGINANLWVGIVLLLGGGFFVAWAWLRPIQVPDEIDHDGATDGQGH